mgnify:CR=1 FL=1
MVSESLGIQAFRRLLHKDAGDILAFHHVVWYIEARPKHIELDMYLICAKNEMVLVDCDTADASGGSRPSRNGSEVRNAPKRLAERTMFTLSYSLLREVILHAQAEDRFGLVLTDSRPVILPPVLQLSTCYRRQVLESLEILYNTYMTDTLNSLAQLPIRFVAVQSSNPRQAVRHPAVFMFDQCEDDIRLTTKVFYRRGYMFLLDQYALDLYELLDNRPCSTYLLRDGDAVKEARKLKRKQGLISAASSATSPDGTGPSTSSPDGPVENETSAANVAVAKHLVVRFMPEKPIATAEQDSALEFQLFVENVAHAVAQVCDCPLLKRVLVPIDAVGLLGAVLHTSHVRVARLLLYSGSTRHAVLLTLPPQVVTIIMPHTGRTWWRPKIGATKITISFRIKEYTRKL